METLTVPTPAMPMPAEAPIVADVTAMQAMVDSLSQLDLESATTVITSILQSRPELAPPIVNFAMPALAHAPQKALVERRNIGMIKSFSELKGFGFIACDEVAQVFGNDVFLHVTQRNGLAVGSKVNFAIVLNKDNKPMAYDLQLIDDGKGKSAGKSSAGKALGKGKGADQDTSSQMWTDMMRQIGGKMSGGGKGSPMMFDQKGGGKGMGFSNGKGQPDEVHALGEFIGVIKSFNPTKGYGFIECGDLRQTYGCDVYINTVQMCGFRTGDAVAFVAYVNTFGKPQARDLKPWQ